MSSGKLNTTAHCETLKRYTALIIISDHMIKEIIQEALNEQINKEFYSAYLYLSMSANFGTQGLRGFASWMTMQAQEELMHAMKLYNYILERGGTVTLLAIDKPPSKWDSPLAVFENSYRHEQMVTGLINELVNLAIAEKDHATTNMLQWFVNEQVEEEASADAVLQKLRLIGDDKSSLFLLDQEVGQRLPVIVEVIKGGQESK